MKKLNGLSNTMNAQEERDNVNAAIKNFGERAKVLGRFPGTHSLGKEFETPKKSLVS